MRRAVLLLAVLSLASGAAWPLHAQTAPNTARRIDLTVLDEQGLPLFGAQVTALQSESNLRRTAASAPETDAKGLSSVPAAWSFPRGAT